MIGFSELATMESGLDHTPPVIVLGVETPIGVAVLRDLGRHGYSTIGIGRSKQSIGLASRYCERRVIRAASELELIVQLQTLSEQFPRAALIVISENDQLLINRHRSRLDCNLQVLVPDQETLERVLDKSRCLEYAQQSGIRIPITFAPLTMEEVERRAKEMSYPCIIKWADPNQVGLKLQSLGLTAHKCQYAHNAEDLIVKLQPYAAIDQFPLVQEYCPGQGIGQMFLVRNGKIILQFQHQRIHEWPPEGGVSTLCKSLPIDAHQSCLARSKTLLKALHWNGVAMVEYRYDDSTDTYYFMEINGRFWGSLPLAIAAGVPFASGLVKSQTTDFARTKQPAYPTLYCRFMIPEIRRLARLLLNPSAIQDPFYRYSRLQELREFLVYFLRPRTRYYLFSIDDPGPFFADLRNVLLKMAFWRS